MLGRYSSPIQRIWEEHKSAGNSAGDLFGTVKWPFQRLSDLQLGDKKVTAWITWQVVLSQAPPPPKFRGSFPGLFSSEGPFHGL